MLFVDCKLSFASDSMVMHSFGTESPQRYVHASTDCATSALSLNVPDVCSRVRRQPTQHQATQSLHLHLTVPNLLRQLTRVRVLKLYKTIHVLDTITQRAQRLSVQYWS